jgi:hypothetical protein
MSSVILTELWARVSCSSFRIGTLVAGVLRDRVTQAVRRQRGSSARLTRRQCAGRCGARRGEVKSTGAICLALVATGFNWFGRLSGEFVALLSLTIHLPPGYLSG